MEKIDVVVVTYNRLDKLKKTLLCYDQQTVPFRNLIVVDNNSTDGTVSYLKDWEKTPSVYGKYVLFMNDNIGGAGGFYEGQKFAVSLNPDWILLADDDAYPSKSLIAKFQGFVSRHIHDLGNVVALCTSVHYPNGEICFSHRSRFRLSYGLRHYMDRIPDSFYQKEFFDVDFFSYVGAIIKVDAIKKVGYDKPQYFIYYDDSEHCMRLRKIGRIVCVPDLEIIHDSGWDTEKTNPGELISWRDYYSTRNRIHMLKIHYFLPALWFTFTRFYNISKNTRINWRCKKMLFTAIKDAWFNHLGKHSIYKPGWINN